MTMKRGHQIIKTRDDHAPVRMQRYAKPSDPGKLFVLSTGVECFWMKDNEPFGSETLRQRIEPWLTPHSFNPNTCPC